jgi:hypothetical protein
MAISSPSAEEAGALGGDELADGAEGAGESWLGGALRPRKQGWTAAF